MVIETLDTIVTSSLITSKLPAVRTSFRSSNLASLALFSLVVEYQLFFAPHPMSQPQSFYLQDRTLRNDTWIRAMSEWSTCTSWNKRKPSAERCRWLTSINKERFFRTDRRQETRDREWTIGVSTLLRFCSLWICSLVHLGAFLRNRKKYFLSKSGEACSSLNPHLTSWCSNVLKVHQ